MISFWIQTYFELIIFVSIVSAILFHFKKKKTWIIILHYDGSSTHKYHKFIYAAVHFGINCFIFLLGSIPILLLLNSKINAEINTLTAHFVCSMILTGIIFYLWLKNWKFNAHRKYWWQSYLEIFPNVNYN